MYQLNDEQINLIKNEVERQDIHLGHLAADLLDHICCEIEEQIWQGQKFQTAFNNVLNLIGNDGLTQIQNDTLYLTDKKYRTMKNLLKIAGVAGMALISAGALFKIDHWPGANVLFVLGFFLLGAIFFPVSIFTIRKESSKPESPVIYGSALIGGLLTIFAPMLKVLHWPGANLFFLVGYALLGIVFLPLMLNSLLKNTKDNFFRSTYIVGAISLFFCLAGSLFKILHLPGAFILVLTGSLSLTMLFLPLYTYKVSSASSRIPTSYIFLVIGILYFNLFNLLLSIH